MAENQPIISPSEEWRPVVGYEELYEVSSHGRVRSLARTIKYKDGRRRIVKERIMKPLVHTNGYIRVHLSKNNRYKIRYVHSLVAESFIGPRPEGVEVCHNDGTRDNNVVENLRYDTRGNNVIDAVKHGTNVNAGKTRCPRGHLLEGLNLVLWDLNEGRRKCLACQRAHSYTHYHVGMKKEFENIADSYYRRIMKT